MNVDRTRLVRWAVLVGTLATGAVLAANPILAGVGLVIAWGLWVAIAKAMASRSRLVGGVAMIVYSFVLALVALIATWFVVFWAVVFAHGTWLALAGAART